MEMDGGGRANRGNPLPMLSLSLSLCLSQQDLYYTEFIHLRISPAPCLTIREYYKT